jgi:hypothetical protein
MQFNLTLQVISALRGAPITVYMVMFVTRVPVDQGFIRRHARYTDPIVHDALDLLFDYGLITKAGRYTWQLADGVQQLPLMALEIDAVNATEPEEQPDEPKMTVDGDCFDAGEVEDKPASKNASSSKYFRAGDSSSSRSISRESSKDSQPLDSRASSKFFSANCAALDQAGIREPARSRLAKLAHVTPDLIAYHCESSKSTGQAVYRIEHNWKMEQKAPVQPYLCPDRSEVEREENPEAGELWENALLHLAETVPKGDLINWIQGARALRLENGELTLMALNPFAGEHLLRYEKEITAAVEQASGKHLKVEILWTGRNQGE